jgi:hypothetical protein
MVTGAVNLRAAGRKQKRPTGGGTTTKMEFDLCLTQLFATVMSSYSFRTLKCAVLKNMLVTNLELLFVH